MYEQTITDILKKDLNTKQLFMGVYARDELPTELNYPCCFVINTHTRAEVGEHWLAFYYDINKICYFFDSFGLSPYFYRLINFIKNTSYDFTYNMKRLQGDSDYCGYYCVLFLLYVCMDKLDIFFLIFNSSSEKNDLIIKNEIENN